MLRFSLTATNPFYKKKNGEFLSIYEWYYDVSANKGYEFQLSSYKRNLFGITLDLNWIGQDHASVEFELCILGYTMNCHLYDKRHWNYDEGRWMTQ